MMHGLFNWFLRCGLFIFLIAHAGALSKTLAQSTGDYRSIQSGNWNQTATWERFDGLTWVAATSTPTSDDGVISILDGHTVTVTANVTVDQVVIEAGGQVTLSGGTLTVSNGPGDDFIIFGTYRRTSSSTTMSVNPGAIVRCANGGIYEHALSVSGGSVPSITWEDESIFRLVNDQTTATSVTGLNQSFGIVEINRPGQTTANEDITFGDVRNELRVISTGTGRSRWNSAFSISGSYVQTGGEITVRTNTGASNFNVGGNFSLDGGTFRITDANGSTNAVTLNVDGNFTMSGGTFIFCATGSTSGPAFASIKGDVTISGGSFAGGFLAGASGFYFNGQSSEQTLTFGLSLSSGVLDRFYYRSAVGGPTGLNEIYNGTSSQNTITGTGAAPGVGWSAWPTTGSLIKNVTINNAAGVTLSTPKTVNGTLTLLNNSVLLRNATNNITTASTTRIEGNGTLGGNVLFTNNGTIAPGNSIGTITVNGDYTATSTASHVFEVDGGQNDQLYVTGTATLDGSITVSGNPTANTYTFINASSYGGEFSDVNLPANYQLTPNNGGMNVALPVEFIRFEANADGKQVRLVWETGSEINASHYEIERSGNGRTWRKIGEHVSVGDVQAASVYQMWDDAPYDGWNYYRIKQVDRDGAYVYFPVRTVFVTQERTGAALQVYPTLGRDLFYLEMQDEKMDSGSFYISNVQGQKVFTGFIRTGERVPLHTSDWTPGMYFIRLEHGGQNHVLKMIIQP